MVFRFLSIRFKVMIPEKLNVLQIYEINQLTGSMGKNILSIN